MAPQPAPEPNPLLDIYSSTGPFAGPPRTWQDVAATDDSRQEALAVVSAHHDLMQSTKDLAEANGGGVLGVTRGMIGRLTDQALLNSADQDHLITLFEHLSASMAPGADTTAATAELQTLNRQILDDPVSTPLAVAVSGVAIDSVSSHDAAQAGAYVTGYVDALGVLFGGFGGPITSVAVCVAVSTLTDAATAP